MRLDPQSIINSRLGVSLALSLGRIVPPKLGVVLANFFAGRIAARKNWPMVQAVRSNLWVTSNANLSREQLDHAVRETFRHTANSLYDLYHNLDNPAAIQDMIQFDSRVESIIKDSQRKKEGLVIVGIHLSNFDFVMQSAVMRGLKVLALSVPQPGEGYQWQNELRKAHGMEMIPASMTAIRRATDRLQKGGVVMTGVDRPVPDAKYRPRFFGHPAGLPVFHVFLAMRAKAPVILVAVKKEAAGNYRILVSDPIYMQHYKDRETEIILNAESVLCIAEDFIRQAPHQWAMFYPVWPEVIPQPA